MALIEHRLNGDTFLGDCAVDTDYPKPTNPPGDRQAPSADTVVASADVNANTSNTGDDDNITQPSANDESSGSSDGTDSDTEALEKEMGRYVPRTKPSKPAIGAKSTNSQSKPTNNVSRPSGTRNGRPPAVTATASTTAPRTKK